MVTGMKYGSWNISVPKEPAVLALCDAGYSPLTAHVLCSRGYTTPETAAQYLDTTAPLIDPFALKDMDRAVAAIHDALEQRQRIAVFGDYDVDGITATCLLMDYLRGVGADCVSHIPGRVEEGYGLNSPAIEQLYAAGVRLIISVDCGITAMEEAELCRQLGITLVITDHHECKQQLPQAAAVVNPHRPDCTYPHKTLCGVGIAFKLAAALCGDQESAAQRWCDLVCLGTVADVMPLRGESRRLVAMGLEALQTPARLGVRALLQACGCDTQPITAATISYILAPRINAAGRMERADLAVQLFLTDDAQEAAAIADTLCTLNTQRQSIEAEIYNEATAKLDNETQKNAIVLAGEGWHQGVVGIVASKLSEEFCCPTFLICLDGPNGKASSRSYGGFNLFAALAELAPLLNGYGGHELAAGFTISRENLEEFRDGICRMADLFAASGAAKSALEIDCEVDGELLTKHNISALEELEPCGAGCPKPLLCMSEVLIEKLWAVGNGKHLRLCLRSRKAGAFQAIYFSAGAVFKDLSVGDCIDIAFTPQINEFRGAQTVQLNLVDLRRVSPAALYDRYQAQKPMQRAEKLAIAPERTDIIDVWNYLRSAAPIGQTLCSDIDTLCHAVAAFSSYRHSVRRTPACLDILAQLHLIELQRTDREIQLRVIPDSPRNALENSALFRALCLLKAGEV